MTERHPAGTGVLKAASIQRPDGSSIAYDVGGSGPPMVFLHGLTGNRARWTPITDVLMRDFTCVRIDARGHGESSASTEYSFIAMAQDVGAVLDELGIDAPVIVGSSMGGTTAALCAIGRPTHSVVVVDQPLRPSAFGARIRRLEGRLRGGDFAPAMVEFEESLGLGPLSDAARAELYAGVQAADPEVVLGVWAQVFATSDEDLDRAMAAGLRHLRAPCLCLHGSEPAPGYAAWLKTHVSHAEIEVWHGPGHFLHLIEPQRFADRVRQFAA